MKKMWASQLFDFNVPIFGCSLQVLGANPCQNALFAIYLELHGVSNEATQAIANPLVDEHNRDQSTEKRSKSRKASLIVNYFGWPRNAQIFANKLCAIFWAPRNK
jgi:hypothetical protein